MLFLAYPSRVCHISHQSCFSSFNFLNFILYHQNPPLILSNHFCDNLPTFLDFMLVFLELVSWFTILVNFILFSQTFPLAIVFASSMLSNKNRQWWRRSVSVYLLTSINEAERQNFAKQTTKQKVNKHYKLRR